MTTSVSWRHLFENWPDSIPRAGVLLGSFGDPIPFKDFMFSGDLLLVERDMPDSSGSRKIFVRYDAIHAVKNPSPAELKTFQVMGFRKE